MLLTGSDYMVKTTITDIIRSTVTTDDPLAAFNKILLQISDLLAVVAFILDVYKRQVWREPDRFPEKERMISLIS